SYMLLPGGTGEATLSGTNNQLLKTVKQGTVLLRATIAEDFRFRQAYRDIIVTIVKGTQTISFAAIPDKTFGVAPFDVAATGGGSGNAVVLEVKSGPATMVGNKVTVTGAGTVTIRATQAGNTNFEAAPAVEQSFLVKKIVPVITFGNMLKTYGDNAFNLAATADVAGTITYSVVAGGTGEVALSGSGSRTVTIKKAGTVKLRATMAEQANFGAATKEAELVISKASATITLGNLSQTYTGQARPVTATTTPANLSTSITYNRNAAAPVNAGTYTVAATISDPNYTGEAIGELLVSQASQQITFPALADKTYGDAALDLNATSTGSDLPINYAVVSGPATVAGSKLTLTGAGEVRVRATKPGNVNYTAAPAVERSFRVAKKELTVKAADKQRVYGETNPGLTLTYSGFINGDSEAALAKAPVATTTATTTSAVGTYPIVVAGGEDENYTFRYEAGTFTIGKATAVIALSELEQLYNGEAKQVLYATTPSGLPVAVTYNGSTAAPMAVGEYTVRAVIENENYTGEVTATLRILGPTAAGTAVASNSEIRLYPNPTSIGHIRITGVEQQQTIQVQVLDVTGRNVWQGQLRADVSGELELHLNPDLKPGQYTLQLTTTRNFRKVLKLVKQ
ncbi:T9SS type A sorting domain-containing protein, partial [Pontibacter qinzhouensis]